MKRKVFLDIALIPLILLWILGFSSISFEQEAQQDIQPIAILEGHAGSVNSIAYSPDGSILASGSGGAIKLWDVQSRTLLATLLGHTDEVTSIAYAPDGRTLASGSLDKTIKLWDIQSRTLKTTLEGHIDGVTVVAYSPDGSILASGSMDKSIKLWDVQNKTLKASLEEHTNRIASLSFSPDGHVLASGGRDPFIKLWDAKSMTLKTKLHDPKVQEKGSIISVAFSPDGRIIASGVTKYIHLWDVQSGIVKAELYVWPGVGQENALVYSPDGSMLASAGNIPNIRVWDIRDLSDISCVPFQCGKLKVILEGHRGGIGSLAFSPDGSILASGGWDTTIRLWKLREPTAVAVSPKGKVSTTWGKIKRK